MGSSRAAGTWDLGLEREKEVRSGSVALKKAVWSVLLRLSPEWMQKCQKMATSSKHTQPWEEKPDSVIVWEI